MTLVPLKVGRPFVWNANCVATLATSHVASTAGYAGAAAAAAETLKYSNLVGCFSFEPFGVETLGSWGPSAHLPSLSPTTHVTRGLALSLAKNFEIPQHDLQIWHTCVVYEVKTKLKPVCADAAGRVTSS